MLRPQAKTNAFLAPVLYMLVGTTVGVFATVTFITIDETNPNEAPNPAVAREGRVENETNSASSMDQSSQRAPQRTATWLLKSNHNDCAEQLERTRAQLHSLQTEMEEGKTKIPKASDWTTDFEHREPSEAKEEVVSTLFREALAGQEAEFNAECRGDVCRVDIISEGETAQDAFDLILEAPSYGKVAVSLKSGPPVPTLDPSTKKNTWLQSAWVKMRDEDRTSGWDLLAEVFDRFLMSRPLEECMDLSGSGTLVVMLSVNEAGEFSKNVGGGLAATLAGRCTSKKLDEYLQEQKADTSPVSSATRIFQMEKQDD